MWRRDGMELFFLSNDGLWAVDVETEPGFVAGAPRILFPKLASPADTGVSVQQMEEEADDMIDLARIEGKVRASTLKKIEEIVERHPEETVGIIRQWMNEGI